jgi:hypothetical protein
MGYRRLVRLYSPVIAVLSEPRLPGPNAKPEILKGGVVYADSAMCSSPEQTKIPMDRVIGLNPATFCKRNVLSAADYQMISTRMSMN